MNASGVGRTCLHLLNIISFPRLHSDSELPTYITYSPAKNLDGACERNMADLSCSPD
jgi:hypothetical protein